jgi:hypothetical protein
MLAYDEWWSSERDGVAPGTKRRRKPNSKFATNASDGNSQPLTKQTRRSTTTTTAHRSVDIAVADAAANTTAATTPSPPKNNPILPPILPETATTAAAGSVVVNSSPPADAANTVDAAPSSFNYVAANSSPPPNTPILETTPAATTTADTESEAITPSPPTIPPISGLKKCDDTTEEVEFKVWGVVTDDEWALKCPDGTHIICNLCVGRNRSNGKIGPRRNFDTGHWEDHCRSKSHQDRLANQVAMKRSKDPTHKRKQKAMTNYFLVAPKKSSAEATAPVAAEAVTNSTVSEASNTDNDPDRYVLS